MSPYLLFRLDGERLSQLVLMSSDLGLGVEHVAEVRKLSNSLELQ